MTPTAQTTNTAGSTRTLRGTVVSDRMDKTVTVKVDRLKMQPKYRKQYKVSAKYYAHDPENAYHPGDVVIIRETRPLSKTKRWVVVGKADGSKAN